MANRQNYRDPRGAGRGVRTPGNGGTVSRGGFPQSNTPSGAPPRSSQEWENDTDWVNIVRARSEAEIPADYDPAEAEKQRRRAARRARHRRRVMRNRLIAGTVVGVLLLSGIITLLLPKSGKEVSVGVVAEAEGVAKKVAPLPYGGLNREEAGGTTAAQTVDWGTIGPARQQDTYFLTPLPEQTGSPAELPEFGRVTTEWFADAAFLGDSLTAGFCANEYNIDAGGALICGYEGISPNTVVNRTTIKNPDRGEEVALDVLSEAQPAKLYILLGTNALVATGNDESFLNYYARMLDDLRAALPDTVFYVQSILPCTAAKAETYPGLTPERLAVINSALKGQCEERGCYFLDLASQFIGEDGFLDTGFSQPDGVHLTVSGYSKWLSYLCTHVPYNKNNPYQAGSTWYLSDAMRQQLADIP